MKCHASVLSQAGGLIARDVSSILSSRLPLDELRNPLLQHCALAFPKGESDYFTVPAALAHSRVVAAVIKVHNVLIHYC